MSNAEQIIHFYQMGWEDCMDNDNRLAEFSDDSLFSKSYRYGWNDCKNGDNSSDIEVDKMIEKIISSEY